jgi:tetratricopeptide (TPR) repeat protein
MTSCRTFEGIAKLFAVRAFALVLLGIAVLASPVTTGIGAAPACAQDAWLNRDYFTRGTDGFTQELLANAERNHLAQENFWKKYHDGELEYALGDLKYVLLVFPNHPRALHLMTQVCKAMKDSTTPIDYFEKAIRLFPQQPYTYAQYGAYLLSTGETDAGIARLQDALRLNPNMTYALGLMAEAQKKQRTAPAGTPGSAPPASGSSTTPPATTSEAATPKASTGTPSASKPGTTVH